jgi:hypothetical protein
VSADAGEPTTWYNPGGRWDVDTNAERQCRRCKQPIVVGRDKIGRVVFPGGVCFQCWKRSKGKHLKGRTS